MGKGKVAKGKVTLVNKGKCKQAKCTMSKGQVAKGMVGKGKVAKVAKVSEAIVQKCKAKVHGMRKVMKKPSAKVVLQEEEEDEEMAVSTEEGEEEEPKEEDKEDEEEEGQCAPRAKDYYHFNSKLSTAKKCVQDEVARIKALPPRSGKQAQLQQMAAAFAKSGWNHKLFKSIEQLEISRAQKKEAKAYPRQVMVTKCGGEEGFEKASM